MTSNVASIETPPTARKNIMLMVAAVQHLVFCLLISAVPLQAAGANFGVGEISLISGAAAIGIVGLRIALILAPRISRAGDLVIPSLGLLILSLILQTVFFENYALWLFSRVLHGFSIALYATAFTLWVSRRFANEDEARIRGVEGLIGAFSVCFAPAIGIYFVQELSFAALAGGSLAISLVAGLAVVVTRLHFGRDPDIGSRADASGDRRAVVPDVIRMTLVASALTGACLSVLAPMVTILLAGVSSVLLSASYFTFGVGFAVGRFYGGTVYLKTSFNKVFVICSSVIFLSFVHFIAIGPGYGALLASLGLGAAIGAIYTAVACHISFSIAVGAVRERSLIASSLLIELGESIGPILIWLVGLTLLPSNLLLPVTVVGLGFALWSMSIISLFRRYGIEEKFSDRTSE